MNTPSPLLAPGLEQLGAIVDRLPTGVIVISAKQLDVLYANAAARRLLHPAPLRRNEPLPDPWPDLSLRRYAARLVDPGIAPAQEAKPRDNHMYRVTGIAAGDTGIAVVLLEDISQQERRRQAEREFVANAAHELMTPLTGIVGAAHVLEAGAKEIPEDRDRFIRHIALECGRLTRVSRALLVLARAQSGQQPPRLEVLRLHEAISEAVSATGGDGIEVTCPDAITVFADADLLGQALTNLLANSFRHGSGKLVVTAREVGDLVEIRLVDRGGRLPHGADVTRRFYSGGGPDSGGFGLGLSIARQSLEAMDGRLRLEEEEEEEEEEEAVVASVELPSGRAFRR